MRLALALALSTVCGCTYQANNPPDWTWDAGAVSDATADTDADGLSWTYAHDCGKQCTGSGKCAYVPSTGKCVAVSQADCWRSNSCQVWAGNKPAQYNTCCLREDIPSCGHCELGTDAWNGLD